MGCSLEKSVAEELIVAYAARTLDPEREAEFARHLETCGSCREMAAQQRALWSVLEEWHPLPVSPDFDQRLAQRIASASGSTLWRRLVSNWGWRPAIPVAAACAVLVFAFLLKDSDRVRTPAAQSPAPLRIEQQVEHALDDMDLLKQIGVDVSSAKPGTSQKI